MSELVWRLRNAAIRFGLPNEAADEIERLGDLVEHKENASVRGFEIENELRARVENLEEKAEFWELKAIGAGMGPRITPEMIDSAVEINNRHAGLQAGMLGWRLLMALNIFRCGKCDDEGKTYSRSGSMKEEPMEWTCPDCARFTGHGWVIGGDDD